MHFTTPVLLSLSILFSLASASVDFALSSDYNGQGTQKSWVVDRWVCHDLATDDFAKQAKWGFVEAGLANGCELFSNDDCTGANVTVWKNNSNVLGPGPTNLTGFEDEASSFSCF